MKQSENVKNLLAEMVKIQNEISTFPKNSQAYGYKYTDLDTIITKVKPILAKHNIGFLQSVTTLENGDGITTRIFNAEGDYIEDTARLPVITGVKNNSAQTAGMSISYMRRYSLCAMLGITSDEDTDGNTTEAEPSLKGGNSTPEESKEISNLLKSEYSDGGKIFTVDEIRAFLKKREIDYTAQQLITVVKNEIQRRIEINNSKK
jgi:hypothetical protein